MPRYLSEVAVLAAFKINNRLPHALWDDVRDSCNSALVCSSPLYLSRQKARVRYLFDSLRNKFSQVYGLGLWSISINERLKTESETKWSFWERAVSMCQHGLGPVFLAKKAAEMQKRAYVILERFEIFCGGFRYCSSITGLHKGTSGELVWRFLPFMFSKLENEGALKSEADLTLWNPVVNAVDRRGDKRERERGRARYTWMPKLLMEHLESECEQV